MEKWTFYGKIKENDDGSFVIEIPNPEYPRARGLKGQSTKVVVDLG